jgi:hypothetical protein
MPKKKFREVFGLKGPSMSVPNLFFARPSPKLQSPLGKGHKDILPAPYLPYFTPPGFYLFLKI